MNAVAALLADGVIDDPWVDGRTRFEAEPAVLDAATASALAEAACTVAMMLDQAVPTVAASDALLHDLGLPPSLAAVARLDAPRWLALARADVFLAEGCAHPQVCEINCDTPTGLAECTGLGAAALAAAGPGLADPSARLRQRWVDMIRSAAGGIAEPVVGIVDPTEMTEDLCHVRLLCRWLEEAGMRPVRGSPFNLHACADGRVGLFGSACDVLVRHYKTDWWAERGSAWRDVPPPPRAEPLHRELALVAAAQAAGLVAVVNPWGSAIAQSKRALALPWECPALFDADVAAAVRRHLPETRFLESVPSAELLAHRERWVLKGAFGCEGEEVIIGARCEAALWAESLRQAAPRQWVAQRAFAPCRDAAGREANHGVFLIGGRPSGIYTRRSAGPTDRAALSCPTLVRR